VKQIKIKNGGMMDVEILNLPKNALEKNGLLAEENLRRIIISKRIRVS
jgi:hypothetical protein